MPRSIDPPPAMPYKPETPLRLRVRLGGPGLGAGCNFEVRWHSCNHRLCGACPHGPYVYLLSNRRTGFPGPSRSKRQVRRYIPRTDPLYYAVLRAAGVEPSVPMVYPAAQVETRCDAHEDFLLYRIRMVDQVIEQRRRERRRERRRGQAITGELVAVLVFVLGLVTGLLLLR